MSATALTRKTKFPPKTDWIRSFKLLYKYQIKNRSGVKKLQTRKITNRNMITLSFSKCQTFLNCYCRFWKFQLTQSGEQIILFLLNLATYNTFCQRFVKLQALKEASSLRLSRLLFLQLSRLVCGRCVKNSFSVKHLFSKVVRRRPMFAVTNKH